jgi:hypothetical protein
MRNRTQKKSQPSLIKWNNMISAGAAQGAPPTITTSFGLTSGCNLEDHYG